MPIRSRGDRVAIIIPSSPFPDAMLPKLQQFVGKLDKLGVTCDVSKNAGFDPSIVGFTINNAGLYTRNRVVTLSIHPPAGTQALLISNDGGFGESATVSTLRQTEWTLTPLRRERLPKTVYLRFLGTGLDETKTFTDDIILDQTKPVIEELSTVRGFVQRKRSIARRRAYALSVKANDANSGVSQMQIAFGKNIGGYQPFKKTKQIRAARGTLVSVRVRDGAKNVSRWRSVRVR